MKLCLIRPPYLVDTFLSPENGFTCPRGKVPPFILAFTPARAPDTSIACAKPTFLPALQAASQLSRGAHLFPCTGSEMCCSFSKQTLSSTEINFGSLKLPFPTKHRLSFYRLRRKDVHSCSRELRKARKDH